MMESIHRVAVPTGTEIRIHSDTDLPDRQESKEIQCLYHCTRLEFLDEILKRGLVPLQPLDKLLGIPMFKFKAVFLSETPFEWMHYAQILPDANYAPGAMITINATGLQKIPCENHDGDWAVLERINPDRFLQIAVSTSEDPCNFKEFIRRPDHGP